jgi:hypothetical protein
VVLDKQRVTVMNGVAVIRDMVPHNLYLVTFVLGSLHVLATLFIGHIKSHYP